LHVSGFEFGEVSLAGTVASGTGGAVFTRTCPDGHGLVGVAVRDASACNCSTPASAIGQLVFHCARYTMDASGHFGWDSTTFKDLIAVGSDEQAAEPLPSLHCAADTFIVGLQGATGSATSELTSLKIYCAGLRFATAPTPESGAIVADGGSQLGPVGEGTLDTNASCSAGALARQLDGSADAVVEKLSLSCASVTPTFCGDGVQQPFEACDDGNATAGDGCNTLCQFE
jgi:cysteine-rich repeat protein